MSLPTTVVKRNAPLIRLVLYSLLGLWSFLLFIFCIVRLAYTLTPRREKSLFNGLPFYDPSVVELLVCSILGLGYSVFMFWTLRSRKESNYFSRNWFEVASLFVLWMLWVGGAGAASTVWPDLSFCIVFSPCRILQALMGWAWLGWLTIAFLWLPTLWIVAVGRNWDDHFFDTWGYANFGPSPSRATNANSSGGSRALPAISEGSLADVEAGEREKARQEQHWNFEKEAATMRARLNSWMGHRRHSREAKLAAAEVGLERGGPHPYGRQLHLSKEQEPSSLPPSPPPRQDGALRLNVGNTQLNP